MIQRKQLIRCEHQHTWA